MDKNVTDSALSSRRLVARSETRTYRYNSADLQLLFATIIESLSIPNADDDVVGRVLDDVCRHFRFGCGFVYETDHTRTFHLKERFAGYSPGDLPLSFQLENHLDDDDMTRLLKTAVFYQHVDENSPKGTRRIFDSNSLMLVPVQDKDGAAIGLVGMMDRRRNILLDDEAVKAAKMVLNLLANTIKLRIYQRNLEYAEQSLHSILDNAGVDIYVNDFNTHDILYVNQSMARPYGGPEAFAGKKCWEALYSNRTEQCEYCPQKKLLDDEGKPARTYAWDYRRPFDGSWFRVISSAFKWVDGRLAHVVSSMDITDSKNNEATIAQMANYDALTNLPNRRKLMRDCAAHMDQDPRQSMNGYLLFFDLDNFKPLNDSMGHQAGDEFLTEVGRALQKNPLTKNRSYRYGGDEFIVLLMGVDRDYALNVVRFLLDRFEQPWKLRNGAHPVCRASIGVARFPDDAATPDELLHTADMLMYRAKESGRGMACFRDGTTVRAGDELPAGI